MKDSKYKVVIGILLVVIVCLGGYIVYDSINDENNQMNDNVINENNNNDINNNETDGENNNKDNQGNDNNTNNNQINNQNTVVKYDLDKAEKLLSKYYFGEIGLFQGFVDLTQEGEKIQLTLPYIEGKEMACEKAYKDVSGFKYDKNLKQYRVESNGNFFPCDKTTSVIDYSQFNTEYKKMFGSDHNLPKQNLTYGVGVWYYYDAINDRFILSWINAGGASATHNTYVVKTAEIINNQLIVKVGYAVGGGDYEIELQNGTTPATEFDSLDKKEEFLSKYKDKLKVKTFTFVLDNGNYVLKNIEG